MSDQEIVFVPIVMFFGTILVLAGMFFFYRIAKLILGPKDPSGKRGKRHHIEPIESKTHQEWDTMLKRCERLTQRVAVLEEILDAERERDKVSSDS